MLDIKIIFYDIKGDSKIRKSDRTKKSNEVLKKINIKLKEILEESPDFTGDIHLNFYMGGLANIKKSEDLKIK